MVDYSFVLEEFIPTQRYLLLRGKRINLARSGETAPDAKSNIDMIFMGVEYIEAPMALGLTVDLVRPTEEELERVNRILRKSIGTAIPPEQHFTLKAGEGRYLVAAHSMRVEENDLQYHESLLCDRLL